MILVTVGSQLPFDRLIKFVDDLAPELDEQIIAQVGLSNYSPRNFEPQEHFHPVKFEKLMQDARLIVAHAGVGTILNAQRYNKPAILFPRRASFGEHRNDHQIGTCEKLAGKRGVFVAYTEDELESFIKTDDLRKQYRGDDVLANEVFAANLKSALQQLSF